ncbi:MAG: D-tyrosyl-tRNA(Tyr) deacylase [Bacteroidetes bacterium]|nr:D-tyrosyl-tRNA(Tyr) deacylase [Bacteroidota bacterium]
MRAVIQRVLEASVKVSGETIASIPSGLLVLLGIEEDDLEEDILWLSGKISRLRIFNDAEGIMNLSILDTDKDILVISQFTLHASTKKGNRPSYLKSANPEFSEPFFEKFISQLNIDLGKNVYEGIFGADMKVSLINDGPVTILIDTKNKE